VRWGILGRLLSSCKNKKKINHLDNLPDPDVLAEEIAENLESALGSFQAIIKQLKK
jgi:type I restriction enzyme M protein